MALAAYVDRVVARVRDAPVDLALLPPNVTVGTIFSGATGVALFLVEVARLRGREDALLARARGWLDAADEWARRATPADWKQVHRSVIFGESAYVDALLSAASGDRSRVLSAVERIDRAASRFDDIGEKVRSSGLVGGEAGIVVATRDLLARLPESPDYEPVRGRLRGVHDRVLASLRALHASPLDPRPRALLGAAHGIAGELFVLATSAGADDNDEKALSARLAELAVLGQIDPNGHTYWLPRRESDDITLVGSWCNGTAGHALLWSEVARLKGTGEAQRLAAASARTIAFLMAADASLCCGLAGQSIVLQRFADLSGDPKYSRRAYARLLRATHLAEADHTGAFGFWQGALGVALAALARMHGERSFPCLESPGPGRVRRHR